MTQTTDPRQIIELDRSSRATSPSNRSRATPNGLPAAASPPAGDALEARSPTNSSHAGGDQHSAAGPGFAVSPRDGSRRYIAVAGNIGAGKSSLVEFLCQRYDIKPFFEPNEQNPYLEDFYRDMKAWSFASQIYFLSAKFRLHLELDATDYSVIQDRTIWEDAEIFAENLYRRRLMSKRDYATYRQLYEAIQQQIQPPDLMIYLRCPIRTVRKRISIRGRQMEQNIPLSYLRRLHDLYENWIASYNLSPLVIIPSNRLDYITDLVDCHDVLTTIEKYL